MEPTTHPSALQPAPRAALPEPRTHHKADLSTECFTGCHIEVVVGAIVIGLMLIGVGLPLAVFCTMRLAKWEVEELSFMYRGYDKNRGLVWWESVILLRKTVLVLVAALVADALSQSASAIVILMVSLWLQSHLAVFLLLAASGSLLNPLPRGSLVVLVPTWPSHKAPPTLPSSPRSCLLEGVWPPCGPVPIP
jgi:hypothetical protein